MKIRSLLLTVLVSVVVACGSESGSDQQTPTPPADTSSPGDTPSANSGPSGSLGPSISGSSSGGSSSGGSSSGGSSSGGSSSGGSSGAVDTTDGGTGSSSGGSSSGAVDTDGGSASDGGTGSSSGEVPPPPPPPPPTTAIVGGVEIDFVSQDGNIFCYQVTELDGAKDLSHWDIATNCTVLSGTPTNGLVIGTDPKSSLTGAKWNVTSEFESGLFCLTVAGAPTLGTDTVASKSGLPISYGTLAGPVCQ